jgi:hypothetical protein
MSTVLNFRHFPVIALDPLTLSSRDNVGLLFKHLSSQQKNPQLAKAN